MSLWVFLAALHGLFVLYVAHKTRSRAWTLAAFIAAAVVAFVWGVSGYGPADALAAFIGFVLASRLTAPKQQKPSSHSDPEPPKRLAATPEPSAFSVSVPLLLLAVGVGVLGALVLGGPADKPAAPAAPALPTPAVKAVAAPTPAPTAPGASAPSVRPPRTAQKASKPASAPLVARKRERSAPPEVRPASLEVAPQEKPVPSKHPATLPMGVDHGNHPGFPPECRWVTPIQWSCNK